MDEWTKLVVAAVLGAAAKSIVDRAWPLIFSLRIWQRHALPWRTKQALSLVWDLVLLAGCSFAMWFLLSPLDQPVTGRRLAEVIGMVVYIVLLLVVTVVDLVKFLIRRQKVLREFDQAEAPTK